MPSRNKQRGNELERELVDIAMKAGLKSRRAWGSNGKSLGKPEDVDVEVDVYDVQCKRRKTLPDYLQIPDSCDAVYFRQDRGEKLILIRLDDWISFLIEASNKAK
jgi:Holliday junction resolvase